MEVRFFTKPDEDGPIKHIVLLGNLYVVYRENPFYFEISANPNLLERSVLSNLESSTKFLKKFKKIGEVNIIPQQVEELQQLLKYEGKAIADEKKVSESHRNLLKDLDNLIFKS